ncbi:unnamed protein product [Caenorhabditis angaria]|uniref:Uncharacterized protein n=1 Tax=Caenorhabditis angaria TaxID=860376 RepID=A0A9P1N2R1_9PELO|nr:unnamed protein product [Caenorhabditis angaria]
MGKRKTKGKPNPKAKPGYARADHLRTCALHIAKLGNSKNDGFSKISRRISKLCRQVMDSDMVQMEPEKKQWEKLQKLRSRRKSKTQSQRNAEIVEIREIITDFLILIPYLMEKKKNISEFIEAVDELFSIDVMGFEETTLPDWGTSMNEVSRKLKKTRKAV